MYPFDISILRENVDNDRETERALLEIFVDSVRESLDDLAALWPQEITTPEGRLKWRHHMHRIKGASLNLSAGDLVQVSKNAEATSESGSVIEKQDQLAQAEVAYKAIVEYINVLLAEDE